MGLVVLSAGAAAPADQLMISGTTEFAAAYADWDADRFGAAARLFQQASTNQPVSSTNFYWLGVAHFHQMLQWQNAPGAATNRPAVQATLDAALEAFTQAVALEDRDAESHALLGTLYGMKIKGSLARAAWFGPRVVKHRDRAIACGPDNPRVRYLTGMAQFHTAAKPQEHRAALTTLLAAAKLFDAEAQRPPAPLEPRWGRSSCLTFIGRTYEGLGQPDQAAGYYQKALEAHPADHLARAGLGRVQKK